MTKHYFIADNHYGHNNIHLKFRKEFSSQEEHNETIHNNILSTGNGNDCLWLLGDVFFKKSEMWRLKDYAKKFQRVYYILGNHDYPLAWREAAQYKNVSVMGVENRWGFWISHIPVPECELYRGKSIHGHTHNKKMQRVEHYNDGDIEIFEDDNYFCVSCEQVNYTPISLEEIKDIRGWK